MIRRPPRSTLSSSSAASDVYKRQTQSRHLQPKQSRKEEATLGLLQRTTQRMEVKLGMMQASAPRMEDLRISGPLQRVAHQVLAKEQPGPVLVKDSGITSIQKMWQKLSPIFPLGTTAANALGEPIVMFRTIFATTRHSKTPRLVLSRFKRLLQVNHTPLLITLPVINFQMHINVTYLLQKNYGAQILS